MTSVIGVFGEIYAQKGADRVVPRVSSAPVPLQIRGSSIIVNPEAMAVGRFYCAEIDGSHYFYRKTAEKELEVYGLAES